MVEISYLPSEKDRVADSRACRKNLALSQPKMSDPGISKLSTSKAREATVAQLLPSQHVSGHNFLPDFPSFTLSVSSCTPCRRAHTKTITFSPLFPLSLTHILQEV